ncbi:MAG: hypothetical protein JNN15_20290 [Blastocatellia bacterium]|nr:hypothetical protein [Blastocatellia bacterium]
MPQAKAPAMPSAQPPQAPKPVAPQMPKPATPPTGPKYQPGATNDQAAQRLARLLVTEIKLYNEKKIMDGRKNNNIYDLLKDPIEQSRKHYKERMGNSLEAMPDYFHEELVKTLCEGDASKLGPNYIQS